MLLNVLIGSARCGRRREKPDADARRLTGEIIEESLADSSVLSEVIVLDSRVEPGTEYHRTPWLERWTIHRIGVPEERAAGVAERFREALDAEHAHAWYADFKNEDVHYIAFADEVFRVPRDSEERYAEAIEHNTRLGIPRYQLDF
jgi:hypothetical protein